EMRIQQRTHPLVAGEFRVVVADRTAEQGRRPATRSGGWATVRPAKAVVVQQFAAAYPVTS
ncbi:MAG: hypothetical protein WCJ53_14550, partial [Mycobacteriaceae bacterium]